MPAAFASVDADVYVGGGTASTVDYIDTMNQYLPIVIGFVLLLSFILLMVVFRSIVIPVKAIIMNLLSVGAAYGLIVLVFQEGIGAGLLGFQQSDQIEAWLPVFLFAVLFGLSMDYHVFLLSRIREHFIRTGDNTYAVRHTVCVRRPTSSPSAAIMMVVFGGSRWAKWSHCSRWASALRSLSSLMQRSSVQCWYPRAWSCSVTHGTFRSGLNGCRRFRCEGQPQPAPEAPAPTLDLAPGFRRQVTSGRQALTANGPPRLCGGPF